MKEIQLPSGSTLKIGQIPFADAKALYQSCMEELRTVEVKSDTMAIDLYKNLFCVGFSSKRVERALWECLKRCTYNGHKIEEKTWEAVEARQDYWKVCMEVGEEVITPFAKSLSVEFGRFFEAMTTGSPTLRPETTTS